MEKISCYVNRELSWMKFDERFLEEAADENVPLCERLSFLSIFQSNLEEFFMVRVGTLQDQLLLNEKVYENKTNKSSSEQIEAIIEETNRLYKKRDAIYSEVMEEIKKNGFRIVKFNEVSNSELEFIENFFDVEIVPLLSPMIVGKKQSFPFMANGLIYAVVVMETLRGKEVPKNYS